MLPNDYGFIGPHMLVQAEFWSGVVVGILGLAGALGLAGTWASERHEGGPPSAKVVRGAGVPTLAVATTANNVPSRKPRKKLIHSATAADFDAVTDRAAGDGSIQARAAAIMARADEFRFAGKPSKPRKPRPKRAGGRVKR